MSNTLIVDALKLICCRCLSSMCKAVIGFTVSPIQNNHKNYMWPHKLTNVLVTLLNMSWLMPTRSTFFLDLWFVPIILFWHLFLLFLFVFLLLFLNLYFLFLLFFFWFWFNYWLLKVFVFINGLFTFFLSIGSLWISGFLARSFTEPFWQFGWYSKYTWIEMAS